MLIHGSDRGDVGVSGVGLVVPEGLIPQVIGHEGHVAQLQRPVPALGEEGGLGQDMALDALILKEAEVKAAALEHRDALHPGGDGVELLAEQQGLVAVLAETDMVAGYDHIQTLLQGAFLFRIHLAVVYICICHGRSPLSVVLCGYCTHFCAVG